jgi:hypothetical protein
MAPRSAGDRATLFPAGVSYSVKYPNGTRWFDNGTAVDEDGKVNIDHVIGS